MMRKPEQCRMHVQHCESCEDWESIPFHNEGGLCLRRNRLAHRKAAANMIYGAAKDTRAATRRPIGLK